MEKKSQDKIKFRGQKNTFAESYFVRCISFQRLGYAAILDPRHKQNWTWNKQKRNPQKHIITNKINIVILLEKKWKVYIYIYKPHNQD